MKSIFILFFILFSSISFAFGQTKIDIIYLINGDIYKGKIIKDEPGDYVQIKMRDGSIVKCLYSEIAKREAGSIDQFKLPQLKNRIITFGFKSALCYSTLTGDGIDNTEFKSGVAFGGFVNFPVRMHASIQVELMYLQNGAKHTATDTVYYIDNEILALPVTVLIEFPLGEKSNLNIFPGIGVGYNMSSIESVKFNRREIAIDYSNWMKTYYVFLTAGISYDTKISKDMKLIFDVRANSSLTSLCTYEKPVRDLSIYFSIGFGF